MKIKDDVGKDTYIRVSLTLSNLTLTTYLLGYPFFI